ncbi:putative metallopeptidase [Thermosphaera sp.]|uniref:Metallopeptidase n=1 Tax=Thermosphaera aggregans TaxID=54254 RepID=A0A7C2BLD5_9CREN
MIKYFRAEDVLEKVREIVKTLQPEFNHIDLERVVVVRSIGSKSRALARIHGFPRIYAFTTGMKPFYIIELISERYDRLPEEEKDKVLIHELLHIPRNFAGGLRPHGKYVNGRMVNQLYKKFIERKNVHV